MRASSVLRTALFVSGLSTALLTHARTWAADPPQQEANTDSAQRYRLDFGLSASHFQQQAKTEIGGERGERLIDQTEIGVAHFATAELLPYLHAGLFTQLDLGSRNAGSFESFDERGQATLGESVGGDYWEWWLGPLVRAQYRALFVELGWGALGFRDDDGRADIPATDGSTNAAFRVTPSVAWLVTLGGIVPVSKRLAVSLRAEYRVRYYRSRGGKDLSQESALGSQNLTPIIGLSWSL